MTTIKGTLRDFGSYQEKQISGFRVADAVPLSVVNRHKAGPSYAAKDRENKALLLYRGDRVRAYFRRPDNGELYFYEGTLATIEKDTVKLRNHCKNGEGTPNEKNFFLVRLKHPDLVWWELVFSNAPKNAHKRNVHNMGTRRR